MIALLADHNIEGQAKLLLGTLQALGWVDLLELRLGPLLRSGIGARQLGP